MLESFLKFFVVFFLAALLAAAAPILGIIAFIVLAIIVYPWVGVVVPTVYYALVGAKGQTTPAMPAPGTAQPGGEPPAPAA